MVTLMDLFRKCWVLSITSHKNGDKNKLTGVSNVKSEPTTYY
jgi:hypothetical protein